MTQRPTIEPRKVHGWLAKELSDDGEIWFPYVAEVGTPAWGSGIGACRSREILVDKALSLGYNIKG